MALCAHLADRKGDIRPIEYMICSKCGEKRCIEECSRRRSCNACVQRELRVPCDKCASNNPDLWRKITHCAGCNYPVCERHVLRMNGLDFCWTQCIYRFRDRMWSEDAISALKVREQEMIRKDLEEPKVEEKRYVRMLFFDVGGADTLYATLRMQPDGEYDETLLELAQLEDVKSAAGGYFAEKHSRRLKWNDLKLEYGLNSSAEAMTRKKAEFPHDIYFVGDFRFVRPEVLARFDLRDAVMHLKRKADDIEDKSLRNKLLCFHTGLVYKQ